MIGGTADPESFLVMDVRIYGAFASIVGVQRVRGDMRSANVRTGCFEKAIANSRDNSLINVFARSTIDSCSDRCCADRRIIGRSSFLVHVREKILLSTGGFSSTQS